jgi:hypothetical protein
MHAGRRQAYPMNTYSYDVMTPGQWSDLERDLDENPPALLYFDDRYSTFVERFRPSLLPTLEKKFRVWAETPDGRWLRPVGLEVT